MEYIKGLLSIFGDTWTNVWGLFSHFVPTLFLAIVLLIIGMAVASIVGKAVAQVITVTKVDKLFESAGIQEILTRMGLKLSIGGFFGVIIKWTISIVFLMASLQIVQLTQVSDFIGQMVLLYLPTVIITAIVLALAAVIADTIKKIVIASAKAANITSANILGTIAKYAVWIFAIIIILAQFSIAKNFMLILFGGIVTVLSIAGGIAFGLGGKEAAARAISSIEKDLTAK